MNECLADQKLVVLRRLARQASRENDGDENLHHVVRDHGGMKLRHVGFEMPRALVIFPEAIGYGFAPSGFDASAVPQHARRIPQHRLYLVRVMRILRGNEFGEERARLGFVRGGGGIGAEHGHHDDGENRGRGRKP